MANEQAISTKASDKSTNGGASIETLNKKLQKAILDAAEVARELSVASGESLGGFYEQQAAQLRQRAVNIKNRPVKEKRDADRAAKG